MLALLNLESGPPPRIEVQGHRGARAVLPENTLPAFEHALEVGADVLELDLAVTRDNVLVVSHDPVLNAQICRGPKAGAVVRALTLEELHRYDCGSLRNPQFPQQQPIPGTRIPTLDEVLALASRGGFHFNLETKSFPDRPEYTPPPEEFARLVVEAVRGRGLAARVIVQSFDFRTLHAVKRLAPEIRLSALWSKGERDFVSIAREAGAGIVSPQLKLVSSAQVRQAHQAGLKVVAWTANTPEEWDRLIAARVDGIITDDPAALIRHLRAKGLR
ncbi:MAG: glycerophosphodiester phosphodiesterase [Acidobacteria bacterium]|nr:glycerophosphodiester phosphodiesterase [Acidobacteriota bacterium]